MEITRTPTVVYAESTPNPATMKFVANRYLVDNGLNLEYTDLSQADGAPLAKKLLTFAFVDSVFISSNFVAVTKNDKVSWEGLVLELRELIQQYLSDGNPVITDLPAPSEQLIAENGAVIQAKNYAHAAPSSDIDQKIIDLLDEYVRPAVEQDGGAIFFKSFKEGIVTVSLRGACSGCPSSSLTLKSGIEALLKRMLPEVIEVIAEAC